MSSLLEMQTFVEIVDRGSLSAASRSLGAVPSTVSARLTALEDRLGVRLLTRTTRQLRLTESGARYLADCRRILAEIERSEQALRSQQRALSGTIRITAPSDFGRTRLRPVLDALVAAHPRLSVHLHLSDRVVDLVGQDFDLAVRVGHLPESSLVARRIATGHRLVCAAPEYWARHGRPAKPEDLAKHECLLWTPDGVNEATWTFRAKEDAGRPRSVRVRGRRASNDGEVVRAWALAGLGVAQKSYWDVAADLEAGRLEPVLRPYARRADLHAVHARGRHLPHRVRVLVDHLAHGFAKLYASS